MNIIPLEGYECMGHTPIPEPVGANSLDLGHELQSILVLPSQKELGLHVLSTLAALQTAVSFVTLSALERIVLHYDVLPASLAPLFFVMAFAGEIIVFGVCGQIFEIHVKKILFYKSMQFGVIIDFKNVKTRKKYLHSGGVAVFTIFVISLILMCMGYSVSQEKSWSDVLTLLIAMALIGNHLHKVIQPYLDCSALEDSLISVPKFLEKDPVNMKSFLSNCQVLPEKAVYARLCDLINIQHEACLRAQISFARSAGIQFTDPSEIAAKVKKNGDKSQISKFETAMLDARKSRPISFSQLQDCGVEGKEIRGAIEGKFRCTHSEFDIANWFNGKVGSLKYENDKYIYRVKNTSKDADSILVGRYTKLLVLDENLYWMDEDVDKLLRFQGKDGLAPSFPLNRQLYAVLFALLAAAFFSFVISGTKVVAQSPSS